MVAKRCRRSTQLASARLLDRVGKMRVEALSIVIAVSLLRMEAHSTHTSAALLLPQTDSLLPIRNATVFLRMSVFRDYLPDDICFLVRMTTWLRYLFPNSVIQSCICKDCALTCS
jgi:hypothetical protein